MISEIGSHRGRKAQRLMNPNEVVMNCVDRNGQLTLSDNCCGEGTLLEGTLSDDHSYLMAASH